MRCLALCLLLGLALPAAAGAADSGGRLLVLGADGGTLTPRGQDRFDLTLRGVDRTATWFADRPQRGAGTTSVRTLVRDWKRLGLVADPPNAAIELPGGRASADTLIVELGTPRYDRASDVLRVRVRRIAASLATSRHARRADRTLPRRFGRASLFVDNVDGNVARALSIELTNATSGTLVVQYAVLTGGNWDTVPAQGTAVPAYSTAAWTNVSASVLQILGGELRLLRPDGGAVEISWVWSLGSLPTVSATPSGTSAIAVHSEMRDGQTRAPLLNVAVVGAGS